MRSGKAGRKNSRKVCLPTLFTRKCGTMLYGQVFWLPVRSTLRAFPSVCRTVAFLRISSPVTAARLRRIFTALPWLLYRRKRLFVVCFSPFCERFRLTLPIIVRPWPSVNARRVTKGDRRQGSAQPLATQQFLLNIPPDFLAASPERGYTRPH